MDRLVFLSTAALGVAFLVLYGFRCWRRSEQVDVGVLVHVMLEAGGVVAGAFLILSTIVPDLKAQLATVDIYIFISGLVVFAVSAQGLGATSGPPRPAFPPHHRRRRFPPRHPWWSRRSTARWRTRDRRQAREAGRSLRF